jgi:SAM-dependent methyltransferase/uncharacterized protein YbaR (Trm112 family)
LALAAFTRLAGEAGNRPAIHDGPFFFSDIFCPLTPFARDGHPVVLGKCRAGTLTDSCRNDLSPSAGSTDMKTLSPKKTARLLESALPLLRCPACKSDTLTQKSAAKGLACPACGRDFPLEDGVLNLYTGPECFTLAQRSLQTRLTTRLYECFRWLIARLMIGYSAAEEIERWRQVLSLRPGETLLDIACGPGIFTIPLARIARPGLVIGLDISPSQLQRAAVNVARAGLDNVLLVRGDVHQMPFKTDSLPRITCAGGLHQFPQPNRAFTEIARVLEESGQFAGSTFARHPASGRRRFQDFLRRRYGLNFVDLAALADTAADAGFGGYHHEFAPIPWFGYYEAAKVS